MSGTRYSPCREPGCTATAATKITPQEREALDALAGSLGMSRYEFLRETIRATLAKAGL